MSYYNNGSYAWRNDTLKKKFNLGGCRWLSIVPCVPQRHIIIANKAFLPTPFLMSVKLTPTQTHLQVEGRVVIRVPT